MGKRRRGSRKRAFTKQKVQNSQTVSRSGAGQAQDLGYARAARNTSHPLDRSASDYIRAREWAQLYYKDWTARKIVDIPVADMLRVPWEYKGLDEDQTKLLNKTLKKLGFRRALTQALKMERLVGGSIILMGIRGETPQADKPLDFSTVGKDDLTFLNVVPRTKVSSYQYDVDPMSPDFGKPDVYTVWQHIVHKSRMLIFDGSPLTDNEVNDLGFVNRSFDSFGVSVLASVYDDIIRSVGSRQAATQLIQRASVLLINNNSMQNMLAENGGSQALNKLQDMADQMSMFAAAMIDGKNVNLDQWSASFGAVPELLMSFLQIISAGTDIPATRFLGQAPGGLNATGESDLENYYNMIQSHQNDRLKPQLEKLLQVVVRSVFGDAIDPDTVEIEFPPLWNPSELEESQVRTADATNIINALASDIITREEARKEMKERGIFETDIKEDALPEVMPGEQNDTQQILGDLNAFSADGPEQEPQI